MVSLRILFPRYISVKCKEQRVHTHPQPKNSLSFFLCTMSRTSFDITLFPVVLIVTIKDKVNKDKEVENKWKAKNKKNGIPCMTSWNMQISKRNTPLCSVTSEYLATCNTRNEAAGNHTHLYWSEMHADNDSASAAPPQILLPRSSDNKLLWTDPLKDDWQKKKAHYENYTNAKIFRGRLRPSFQFKDKVEILRFLWIKSKSFL